MNPLLETIFNITGILGFVLSTMHIFWDLWKKRTNIILCIENLEYVKRDIYTELIFHIMLINKSSDPINITRIVLIDNAGKEYNSLLEHHWIGEIYYPKCPETDIPITERKLSADFPINLLGNGAKLTSIVFHVDKELPNIKEGELVHFKVFTDKKIKNIKSICFKQENEYLYM